MKNSRRAGKVVTVTGAWKERDPDTDDEAAGGGIIWVGYSFTLGQGMRIFVSDVNAQQKAPRYSGCLIIRRRDWPFL